MNRRDALQRVAVLMGGLVSAPTMAAMLEGNTKIKAGKITANSFTNFTPDQLKLVSEIAEVIIPKTDTPGAKDAGVGAFIEVMLRDCYSQTQQESFINALTEVEAASQTADKKSFIDNTLERKTELLKYFEKVAKIEEMKNKDAKKIIDAETGLAKDTKGKEAPPVPFFQLMKELTLLGYFTSEEGATKALAYVAVPGKYVGCVKMEKGQKAWALN